ncbi:MAG: hypothetical protein Q9169_003348 [Polycauliona sp. 2 TL-2023]
MARKRKPVKQPKRLEVTGPDGWTHVLKGLKSTDHPRLANQPPEIPPNQTLKDLEKTHSKYRSQWLSSSCYQNTRKMFLEDVIPSLATMEKNGGGRIESCVMLGLGSLSNGQRSSWWELVFLESVLALLSLSPSAIAAVSSPPHVEADQLQLPNGSTNLNEEKSSTTPTNYSPSIPTWLTPPPNTQIPIYIQDPIFNPLDITYLSSLNFTVLDHPAAFPKITRTTFLFAPHLEMELYARALGAATGQSGQLGPRLCIGTDVTECMDQLKMKLGNRDGEEEEERKRQEGVFRRHQDAMAEQRLPGFERDDWMGFTCVYWAKAPVEGRNLEA